MISRDEHAGETLSLRRKALLLFSALAFVALLVGALFGDKGMLRLAEQRARRQALEQQVESLRGENAELTRTITALRSDPRAIERLAREELGLLRPGETVFVLGNDAPSAP
jgi:cell division protein FtsB